MSRYETLSDDLNELKTRQAIALLVPTALTIVLVVQVADVGATKFLSGLATLVVVPFILHWVWRGAFPAYREWSDRTSQISAEMAALERQIANKFDKYRERRKGERFKQAYDLTGRTVPDLEEALSIGMYREKREVFVTAFIRLGVAVRVTASIGSPYRCSAADDPTRWKYHFQWLQCDEIRQYHNHPCHTGSTSPSAMDVKSSEAIRVLLDPHGAKLRSLIICWNSAREWKVFEYDETGRHWLHFEFDAAICNGT